MKTLTQQALRSIVGGENWYQLEGRWFYDPNYYSEDGAGTLLLPIEVSGEGIYPEGHGNNRTPPASGNKKTGKGSVK